MQKDDSTDADAGLLLNVAVEVQVLHRLCIWMIQEINRKIVGRPSKAFRDAFIGNKAKTVKENLGNMADHRSSVDPGRPELVRLGDHRWHLAGKRIFKERVFEYKSG